MPLCSRSKDSEVEGLKARDIMRPTRALHPDDPARELLRLFEESRLRAIPVVSSEGELIGLVTDRDLLSALLPAYVLEDLLLARVLPEDTADKLRERFETKRVKNAVNVRRPRQPPVGPDDTLIEVTSMMLHAGEPAIAVVENDVFVGLITMDDLLPAILRPGA